jgi:hypothetical protein
MNDHRKQQVIAKLIAARAELEDVLNISTPRARYDSPTLPDATGNEIAAIVRDLERIVQALERTQ